MHIFELYRGIFGNFFFIKLTYSSNRKSQDLFWKHWCSKVKRMLFFLESHCKCWSNATKSLFSTEDLKPTLLSYPVGAATASADVASTSCLGSQQQPTPWNTCWTCEGDLSPDHKCDGPAGHIYDGTCMSPLNPAVVRPSPSAPIVLKKPVKMVDGSPIWTPRTKSNRWSVNQFSMLCAYLSSLQRRFNGAIFHSLEPCITCCFIEIYILVPIGSPFSILDMRTREKSVQSPSNVDYLITCDHTN